MKKIFILLGILLLFVQCADAGIITSILNSRNNGYYYSPNRYYRPHQRHYGKSYRYNRPRNYYYNQRPVIYRNTVRRTQNNSSEKYVSSGFSGIEKIERKIFDQTYEYDTAQNRIERLEQKMFGTIQSGNLYDRFDVIKNASKNYMTFNPDFQNDNNSYRPSYSGYSPPIYTGTAGSSWRQNILGNFRNQLMGMPTGFTPAMDPAYMDYFEAERLGQDIDYRTNRGYYHSKTNRGAGAGVTILD